MQAVDRGPGPLLQRPWLSKSAVAPASRRRSDVNGRFPDSRHSECAYRDRPDVCFWPKADVGYR
jgi:hypothetical protein